MIPKNKDLGAQQSCSKMKPIPEGCFTSQKNTYDFRLQNIWFKSKSLGIFFRKDSKTAKKKHLSAANGISKPPMSGTHSICTKTFFTRRKPLHCGLNQLVEIRASPGLDSSKCRFRWQLYVKMKKKQKNDLDNPSVQYKSTKKNEKRNMLTSPKWQILQRPALPQLEALSFIELLGFLLNRFDVICVSGYIKMPIHLWRHDNLASTIIQYIAIL